MIDEILLTQDDFAPYRDISENVDFERLTPWILEAQKIEMRTFLGPELYLKMITDFDGTVFLDPIYNDLWEGTDTVNYRFYGLKPVIIYFAYARFLKNQPVVVTRYGVKNLVNDSSNDNGPGSTRVKQAEAENMAISLQTDCETFLTQYPNDYPDYQTRRGGVNQKNNYINISRGGRWAGLI